MGRGLRSFRSPEGALDAGNSGTTMRPMTGVPAPEPFDTRLSAAFWIAAAAAMPGSVVSLADVGLNPTRTALIGVLRRFGANVDLRETANTGGEPIGTIIVAGDRTGSIHIQPHEVPELIDELPAITALAAPSGEVRVDGISYSGFFEALDRLVA
jgi:3-phosphoshikimate 1-carboxyvinyltransferase